MKPTLTALSRLSEEHAYSFLQPTQSSIFTAQFQLLYLVHGIIYPSIPNSQFVPPAFHCTFSHRLFQLCSLPVFSISCYSRESSASTLTATPHPLLPPALFFTCATSKHSTVLFFLVNHRPSFFSVFISTVVLFNRSRFVLMV